MSKTLAALKRAVEADGRSQRQISIAAKIPPSSLCRLLSGEQLLGIDAAERLAQALGLDITIGPAKRTRKGR